MLVTSADDQFIRVYNTATGQLEKSIASHKYGASCVRWTHSEYAVVHASTKVRHLTWIMQPANMLCAVRGEAANMLLHAASPMISLSNSYSLPTFCTNHFHPAHQTPTTLRVS